MSIAIPYRPLGLIKELLEQNGFKITHCYEDLVFMAHNAFLVQMGETGEVVYLVFNVDCDTVKREEIFHTLSAAGKEPGLHITARGTYTIMPNEQDNTLDIEFNQ